MAIEVAPAVLPRVRRSAPSARPAFLESVGREQLAADAALIIQGRLHADLVWVSEVACPLATPLACRDGDEGYGPPPITVLASVPSEVSERPDRTQPVLPTCLSQIAWDVSTLNRGLEMSLRGPARILSAVPVTLQSGARLVVIVVMRHHDFGAGEARDLAKYAANLGHCLDLLVAPEQSPIPVSGE